MSATLIDLATLYAQLTLALAAMLAAWRVLRGPRAQDRIAGVDALNIAGMLLLVVTGLRLGTPLFEPAMIIGILGFVSTMALAKFLLRGEVIE